jgi:hypothetical protein
MKKFLSIIAFSLMSVSAFCLPTLDTDGCEYFFTNDSCELSPKAKKAAAAKSKDEIAFLLEVKGGYFFFTESKMREVYDQGGLDLQLAMSGRLWKAIHLYGSVEYMQRSGKSLNDHQQTSIQLVPLSFGIKPTFNVCKGVDYYVNLGPRYFIIHQHNKSDYVNMVVNENGLGGFVGTGFYFRPNKHLVFDAYGEFSFFQRKYATFKKPNMDSRDIDLGGFSFGGGVGYAF